MGHYYSTGEYPEPRIRKTKFCPKCCKDYHYTIESLGFPAARQIKIYWYHGGSCINIWPD